MVRSLTAALAATAMLLAAFPAPAPASAAPQTATKERLERYWRSTYNPRARTAHDEQAIPLLAKSAADECYGGVGATYLAKDGDCPASREPKVNQAYLWALTKSGRDLWIGTAPNTLCLVLGQMGAALGGTMPAIVNDAWSCEFGQSGYRASLTDPTSLLALQGDWRPPKLLRYVTATGALEDKTTDLPAPAAALLNNTLGVRSAGSLGRTVFLAGPARSLGGIQLADAINVFAFDGVTGAFVAAKRIDAYADIRRWIVADGRLYTAVGRPDGEGALLRWDGDPANPGTADAPSPSLFDLTEVGTLPAEGADLTEHQGRIYVTTWSVTKAVDAGVYMSRPLDQMTGAAEPMEQIWSVDDYEPDALIASTYYGGAIASYDGHLVWGTIHAPLVGGLTWIQKYGTSDVPKVLTALLGGWRATALFDATSPADDAARKVRVLYGNTVLPSYDAGEGRWVLLPNKAHQVPKYGSAGFDNPWNNYTWAMGVTGDGLYVGTMDWSYLATKILPSVLHAVTDVDVSVADLGLPLPRHGADLMRFGPMYRPAVPVSRGGIGNFANYGVRTMAAEPERLYLGTANPMNLLPQGGWELRRIGAAEPPVVVPDEPAKPAAPAAPQTAAGVSQTAASTTCVSKRRFTMHLGLRLKVATARGMRNVRSIRATVDGKAVKAKRTTRGITVPVDLRAARTKHATVRVQLTLRKPVRVQRRNGGSARTRQIVRVYRFTTC